MEIRVAESKDANDITRVINAAFRKAETFLIDQDRIDLETVRSLMQKGKFLRQNSSPPIVPSLVE